jgi:vesicle coat complex subunit
VRKTAAVCVAKLHDINAQLVEDQGFLDLLKDLLSDSNPMVIYCPLLYYSIVSDVYANLYVQEILKTELSVLV